MRAALNSIYSFMHRSDLNSKKFFDKIICRNVKEVQTLLNRLKKHNPEALPKLLYADNKGMLPLSYAIANYRDWNNDHYQIAIALLEAGANPHVFLGGEKFEGETNIHYAVKSQLLHVVRLLTWYKPEGFLTIPAPKSTLTIADLLIDWSLNERRLEVVRGTAHSSPEGPVMDIVKKTVDLARQRFSLVDKIQQALKEKAYVQAIDYYLELNQIYQENAELEDKIFYEREYESSRPYLIKFYQNYGKGYLHDALNICQERIAILKKKTPQTLDSTLALKAMVEAAIKITNALKDEKSVNHYQRKLERLNTQIAAIPRITLQVPQEEYTRSASVSISPPAGELFTRLTVDVSRLEEMKYVEEDPVSPMLRNI